MAIKMRLNRLEQRLAASTERRDFDDAMADMQALGHWLDEHGFEDCQEALAAKARPPLHLESPLAIEAQHDPRRRAWKRVEAALEADQVPDDADVLLVRTAA